MDHRDSDCGHTIAKAAARLIGAPFRLNGRDPDFGLDCVGLVQYALEATGITLAGLNGYRLRNHSIDRFLQVAENAGLKTISGTIVTGDIVLVTPGPAQHHLLVIEDDRNFIHAHAGLRKVVRSMLPAPWSILSTWRAEPRGSTEY
jgi:cell wall-associated NlpC family hydrolase